MSLTTARIRLASNIAPLPLAITLVGEDGAPLRALGESHEIELMSSSRSWGFKPERIRLSPEKPVENHVVRLPAHRLGTTLDLFARDRPGLLTSDTGDLQLLTARSMVLLMAMAAGMLGAVTRVVYRDRKTDLLPRVVGGKVSPGLFVNGAFGALFGVVLFQLVDLGLLHALASDMDHDDPGLALLIGVGGGFAGIGARQAHEAGRPMPFSTARSFSTARRAAAPRWPARRCTTWASRRSSMPEA